MKKTYITPTTDVVVLNTKNTILTGSETMGVGSEVNGVEGGSRGFGFGADEEE